MRATIGITRSTPAILGLPPDEITIDARYDDHHLEIEAGFRPSRTVAARLRRAMARLGESAAEELLYLQEEYTDRARLRQAEERPDALASRAARRWQLTERQQEVLEAILRGRSNKEIALALHCAERTIEAHITELLRKIGVDSRLGLAARVREFE